MDFSMDLLFHTFTLPSVFANELDYSKSTPLDSQQARELSRHLHDTVVGTNVMRPQFVRKLSFRFARLDLMDDIAFGSVVATVSKMKDLCSVSLQRSGLSPSRLLTLLFTLLKLPHMQGKCTEYRADPPKPLEELLKSTKDEPKYPMGSEIVLKDVCLTDNDLKKLLLYVEDGDARYGGKIRPLTTSERQAGKKGYLVDNPAKGLRKLTLSDNSLSDEAMKVVVNAFPDLTELSVAGNKSITGVFYKCMISQRLPSLSFLNADRTGLDAGGASGILEGMRKRLTVAPNIAVPIEVWLRGMECDESWEPLLDFCAQSRPDFDREGKRFSVKHDLLKGPEPKNRNRCLVHDDIDVVVYIHGMDCVRVVHPDTVSTRSVKSVAEAALREVNIVNIEACSEVSGKLNRVTAMLRSRYREAMKPLIKSGKLNGQVFRIDSARLVATNRFTHEIRSEDGMSSKVIGTPMPGWDLAIEVAIEEDEGGVERLAKAPRR